jgi:hypothetical protein
MQEHVECQGHHTTLPDETRAIGRHTEQERESSIFSSAQTSPLSITAALITSTKDHLLHPRRASVMIRSQATAEMEDRHHHNCPNKVDKPDLGGQSMTYLVSTTKNGFMFQSDASALPSG